MTTSAIGARALSRDQRGAVSVEYLLATTLVFVVTAVAITTLAATVFSHYAVAPVLLQSSSP